MSPAMSSLGAKPYAAKLIWKLLIRVLLCFALVGTVTYVAFFLLHVNALVAGFSYLLVVLVVAAHWGLLESTMA